VLKEEQELKVLKEARVDKVHRELKERLVSKVLKEVRVDKVPKVPKVL
jgi:hypothetical protein